MEIKVTVPESLADITLEQYQKFLKIERDNKNDQFLRQKAIEIFCNIPGSVVLKMKHRDFDSISNHLFFLLQEKPELERTFYLNGREFGFIPNLDRDVSIGEYADLDGYLVDTDKMHLAMGVMYRPITSKRKGKYQIEEYDAEKYAEEMKGAPMHVVTGALLFFYRLGNQLLGVTPKYLERALKERKVREAVLGESGDGISTSINSLTETSTVLRKLFHSTLERHCFSLRMTGT